MIKKFAIKKSRPSALSENSISYLRNPASEIQTAYTAAAVYTDTNTVKKRQTLGVESVLRNSGSDQILEIS